MSASSSSPIPGPAVPPHKHTYDRSLDRSLSRPSSRTSIRSGRAPSPSFSLDDPIAVRNHISTLKHSIRHQQAQVHDLENVILRGPRPYPDLFEPTMAAAATSPPPQPFTPSKIPKRSSFDKGILRQDSGLPLPRRERDGAVDDGIREGIPMSFGTGSTSPNTTKRVPSPTRTLSRIPISSVGNARALADEGQPPTQRLTIDTPHTPNHATLSPYPPSSPNALPSPSPKRMSLTPGGTTKVLADLQTGVVNARNALENTKSQLRLSQRSVAQLTRQTEDQKEVLERLRLENEGLNGVVARKERLLQELLERARKAEAEASLLKTQLKSETSTSKKALRGMESSLAEATALSQKSEREYVTLRDSIKGLVESFNTDTEQLREEMRKREDRMKKDTEMIAVKYQALLEQVEECKVLRDELERTRAENRKRGEEAEKIWMSDIQSLKVEVGESIRMGKEDSATAKQLADELARLRRLMQRPSGLSEEDSNIDAKEDAESIPTPSS
ncbi:uncharacterized protein BT62DRAFT_898204 [Guyanagaster necrorhizus]|uniref:SWI5-dependent HO expression protein 3 n=1 Tax=Guyanagaster necrorhizus TaxID=856835 RepID=A0A9P7VQJ9_9AGAR|nr:uncharacterized protein BT62DRAFT_898204 [Guyanagaster necrorhizus MCA 3950]KAG7445074.1 hypothetical protein BT62DRAFT_898204 [Guyanagaster necrorhizus MCA 3950]